MLLILYDMNHTRTGGLKNARDVKIESELDTGDKELSFTWHRSNRIQPVEEEYIRTETDEYVIKEKNLGSKGFYSITAKLNLEEIEGRSWKEFVAEGQTADEMADYALAGTGWTCVSTVSKDKLRNLSLKKVNSFNIFESILGAFTCEVKWDTINKVVYLMEHVGSDKGAYFIKGLNLKELTNSSDTYDYATRIYPYGADDIDITDVNNGVEYLENHQYSNKRIDLIWEDSNYTDEQALKDDAEYKLNELSKPKKTYSAKIIDLAKMKPEYSVLDYSVGDTVTFIDNEAGINEKQRITKTTEYPENPEKNTCEISNTILTFEKMQKQLLDAAKALENITTDNGTVKGSTIDKIDISQIINIDEELASVLEQANIRTLYVTEQIGSPYGVIARILSTDIETATLNVTNRADIVNEYVTESHVTNGYADYLKVGTLESDQLSAFNGSFQEFVARVGTINNLMFGTATGDSITTEFSNTVIAQVGISQIKNAMIESLDVSKILAGDISTTKFRIVSDSGNLMMSDNTMQISDGVRTRVQIGKDASDDYSMYVWDKDGNLMFDALGMTEAGIQRPIIRNDMVSDTANIDAAKINIESLFTQINGATQTIQSSKIMIDSTGQTISIAFEEMNSKVDNLEVGGRNLLRNAETMAGEGYDVLTALRDENDQVLCDENDVVLAS